VQETQESKIRKATEDDLLELLFFCKKFYKKAGYEKTGKFNRNKTQDVLKSVLESPLCYSRVVEVEEEIKGFAAFTTVDNPFSDTKIGSEIFFWLDDHKQAGRNFLKLLANYESWCKSKNCVAIKFGTVPMENVSKLESLLKKKSFVKAEAAFIKEI
jgi:hypothetical protein